MTCPGRLFALDTECATHVGVYLGRVGGASPPFPPVDSFFQGGPMLDKANRLKLGRVIRDLQILALHKRIDQLQAVVEELRNRADKHGWFPTPPPVDGGVK